MKLWWEGLEIKMLSTFSIWQGTFNPKHSQHTNKEIPCLERGWWPLVRIMEESNIVLNTVQNKGLMECPTSYKCAYCFG